MLTRIALAAAFSLIAGAAHAATITTPVLQGEAALSCGVTNVGTKDAKITSIQLFDIDGAVITPNGGDCGAVLGPRDTCSSISTSTLAGFCEVVGSGKLRVSILAVGSSGVTAALAGTK